MRFELFLLVSIFFLLSTAAPSIADPVPLPFTLDFENLVSTPKTCAPGYPVIYQGLQIRGFNSYLSYPLSGVCWFNGAISAYGENIDGVGNGNVSLIGQFISIGLDPATYPNAKSISFTITATAMRSYGYPPVFTDINLTVDSIQKTIPSADHVRVSLPFTGGFTGDFMTALLSLPASKQNGWIMVLDDLVIDGDPVPNPSPTPSPTPSTSPSPQVDLSISDIALFQPIGMEAPLDSAENPILATITPPTADPAPKVPPVKAEIQLTVDMTGVPPGATSTEVQLKLGSRVIANQLIDISQFQPGKNIVKIDFVPPTDSDLLGVLPLTATVNASKAITESNYDNGARAMNINTMVLCKVEDAGRVVPFHAQSELPWAPRAFGIPDLSSGTFKQFGCSVTDLYMLFSSYGITNTPIGSPLDPAPDVLHFAGLNGESLDPGTLNWAMANYRTSFTSVGSVALNEHNDPIWVGAADVARAGYEAQCKISGSCDPENASNVVSYKGMSLRHESSEPDAIKAIQNEVCNGNPVIMKFKHPHGQHFMLATGIVKDGEGNQTLRLNNPGSSRPELSENVLYTSPALRTSYPSISGYVLYHPSADPSMMFLAAPMGVHFVVTDPLGRRSGINPITGASYDEIPGAAYGDQSIDAPADPGFIPSTAVAERYFISSEDVPPGTFNIQIFSLNGGSYYLDYRGYDLSGRTNDSRYKTGTLASGDSTTIAIKHVITPAPRPNALLTVNKYSIQDMGKTAFKHAMVKISGAIKPVSKASVFLESSVRISIGGVTGYRFELPASNFARSTADKKTFYLANSSVANVHTDSTGIFEISLRDVNLSDVDHDLLGLFAIEIDSAIADKNIAFQCHDSRCSN